MDLKRKRKSENIIQSFSKKRKVAVPSKDLNNRRRRQDNKNELIHKTVSEANTKKPRHHLNIFKNEPKPLPYNNAFELYKSDPPKEKHSIKNLDQWNCITGWRHVVYENEYEKRVTQYQKKMEIFLKSLSPEDLELYFKLKILESKTSYGADSKHDSKNDDSSSSEDE
ncbi:uncharacterized protein LOC112687217 [Sipha flava]|uniref:Uncharacterized protein LOC112687217 n=1 Tax=Sipha flava TaxID=143950 RepID=A0A8B8FYI3_9HEMI|nr:uncharacterized protein LOC112687217 [Sipha flava]